MAAVSPARKAAFNILLAVERGASHSDDLLRTHAIDALSSADRNLATTLVLGVLRSQLRLDQRIRRHLSKPNARLDTEVRIALRLGAFQLLHLDRIPAHAAIDESVEIAQQSGHHFASKMVNAVLRKIAASKTSAQDAAERGDADLQSYPPWMVERWTRFYGIDAARAICAHGQRQPRLSLRIADAAAEAELNSAGIDLASGELLTAARIVLSGDLAATPALQQGRARIQDEGSQLIAELAAGIATTLVQDKKRILDTCAAPGGKTLILAERLPHAQIIACESSEPRLAALKERLSPFANRIECRLADSTTLTEEAAFDLVLADVPCSGTGTLGRNPEIRHRLQPEDLPRQAERQRAILTSALKAARPGGRVVYSTCSLEPEENQQVVAAILAATPDARIVPVENILASMAGAGILTPNGAQALGACLTAEGFLQLLPGSTATDGFFVAVIERLS
jgi:16S rRNA (cytosine967-C5)-methyltransferase